MLIVQQITSLLLCNMKTKLMIAADENPEEIDEVAKQLEHAPGQNNMDRELKELKKRLEPEEKEGNEE
ncbi:hypothetical protein V6N13_005681 [Hibiscus sabdariffa]|uniref:Uncharacterized protein n=1 Tax=Hibiscus sabdariffa TaxID=183260 RepID=A0ABR2EQ18_9ROSI